MTFILGLTGSIGMGKSTTAQMFSDAGCAVWDADAAVHRLYAKGGAAVTAIAHHYPQVINAGAVSRDALRSKISADPHVLQTIQAIVHPLVFQDRAEFIQHHQGAIIVLDTPLLYETGAEGECDAVVVVTTDAKTQRRRVLSRCTMTQEEFALILSRQISDSEKRERADYTITTDTLDNARAQVDSVIADIQEIIANA